MSSNDKSNTNVAITVAVIGVVGTLGAAFFSNWDKIFTQSVSTGDSPAQSSVVTPTPAPTAETDPGIAPTVEDSAPTVEDVTGEWSSEGDITATHLITLDLSPRGRGLDGVLTAVNYSNDNASGVLSIVGEASTLPMQVEIFNQRGLSAGIAELTLEEEVLVWRLVRVQGLGESTLPSLAYLFPVPD